MRHLILNIIGTIHCFYPERRCHVLGLDCAIFHFFECHILPFSDAIFLRGKWNGMLMLDSLFPTKPHECLVDILLSIVCAYFHDGERWMLLNKGIEGSKSGKIFTLVLKKVYRKVPWKIVNECKCILSP